MGRETKIAFDEPLPGEMVVIVLFCTVSGVGNQPAFWADVGDTSSGAKAHEVNGRRKFVVEHNSHSQRKPG